jgi:hypothetical protein
MIIETSLIVSIAASIWCNNWVVEPSSAEQLLDL